MKKDKLIKYGGYTAIVLGIIGLIYWATSYFRKKQLAESFFEGLEPSTLMEAKAATESAIDDYAKILKGKKDAAEKNQLLQSIKKGFSLGSAGGSVLGPISGLVSGLVGAGAGALDATGKDSKKGKSVSAALGDVQNLKQALNISALPQKIQDWEIWLRAQNDEARAGWVDDLPNGVRMAGGLEKSKAQTIMWQIFKDAASKANVPGYIWQKVFNQFQASFIL